MAVSAPAAPSPAIPPDFLAVTFTRRMFETNRSSRHLPYAVWISMAAIFHSQPWALLTIAVGVVLYTIIVAFFRRLRIRYMADPSAHSSKEWQHRFMLMSAASSLCWGVSGAILMSMAVDPARAMLFVMLIGLATGSTTVRAVHRPSLLAYLIPIMGLPSIALAAHGDLAALTVAAGGVVYFLFLLLVARDHRRILVEHATLSHANGDLARQLGASLEETRTALGQAESSRQLLQVVLDNLDDGVVLVDPDGAIRFTNKAIRAVYGLDEAALAGHPNVRDIWLMMARRGDFGPLADPEASIDRLIGRFWRGEAAQQDRTAAGRWVDYRYNRLPDGGMVMAHRDVTDLKAREQELAVAKEDAEKARTRLADAIGAMQTGFVLHDAEERLVVANDAYKRFFDSTNPDLLRVGDTYEQSMRRRLERGHVRAEHAQLGDAWIAEMLEHHRTLGDRDRRTIEDQYIRVSKHRTREGGVVTLVTDLTEARTREAELAEAKEEAEASRKAAEQAQHLMSTVLDASDDGAMLIDAEGYVRYSNRAVRNFYQIEETALGPTPTLADVFRYQALRGDYGPLKDAEATVERLLARWWRGEAAKEGQSPTGRWLDYRYHRLPDGGMVMTQRDVTELKTHEEELAKAKEEAEASRQAAEQAQQTMHTVLDAIDVGAMLVDAKGYWRYANRAVLDVHQVDEETLASLPTLRDLLLYQARRGDFGPLKNPEASMERMEARWWRGEAAMQGQAISGRWLDYRYHRLPDGGMVVTHRDITALKKHEEELAAAKEEAESARTTMRTVLENLTDGAVMYDEHRHFVYRNAAMGRLYGIPEDVLETMAGAADVWRFMAQRGDFGPIEDIDAWVDERVARLRNPDSTPGQVVSATGRTIEMNYRVLPGEGLLAVHRDITELKRNEAELATAKEEAERARTTMHTVLENLTDGVIMHGPDGRFIYRNAAMNRLYGIPAEDFNKMAGAPDAWRYMAARGDYGQLDDLEGWIAERLARVHAADGKPAQVVSVTGRTVEMSYRRLPDGGVLAVHRDITELKRAQAEAEDALSTARTIIDIMPIGAALVDADYRIRLANPRLPGLLGFPEELASEGRPYADAIRYLAERGDFGDDMNVDNRATDLFARIRKERDLRYERQLPNGRHIEFRFMSLPEGGFLGTYVDITDSKRQQEALAHARADAEEALATARTIIETMPIGATLVGPDMRVRQANRRLTALFDLPEELGRPGQPFAEAMRHIWSRGDFGDEEFEPRAEAFFARMREQGDLRYERQLPNGRHVEFHFTMLPDGGFLGAYVDVTEVRSQQEELARARADAEGALSTARTIIETMPVGSALVGPDKRIRLSNERFTEMLELPRDFGREGGSFVHLMRSVWERGDFGDSDFDERMTSFFRGMHEQKGLQYQRQMPSGRYVDFRSAVLADGSFLCTYVDTTEAKRQQQALAKARADAEEALSTVRTIFETMPVGSALVGSDKRIRLSNKRFTELLDLPPELGGEGSSYVEVMRALWQRGDFPGSQFDERVATFFRVMQEHKGLHYQRDMPNGRHVDFSATVLADGGFLCTYVDTTEAKKREAELASARALLQDAIDSTPDGFALWDETDRLIVCNEGYRRYYAGVPVKIEPGMLFADVLGAGHDARLFIDAPDDRKAFIEATLRTRLNPGVAPREHRLRGDLSLQVIDRRTASGGLVSVYADISEQKRRQRELEQARDDAANARARLLDAIEAMPNGFVLADADGRIVIANPRFHEYYASIADIIVPGADMRWTLAEAARRGAVPTGGQSIEDWVETRMAMRANPGPPRETRQPDGRWLVIAERRTREGGYASMYTDISELKRREAELEQARDDAEAANQAKSTFLATMSHEIRTPMNGVLGMMEILERQGIDEEQQTTVETMRESAQSLLRIIDDVLDFSKIEAGRLELESTSFSLSGVIEGAMAAVRPQAVEKSLPLIAKIDPGSSDALEGDPVRVRQILLNLLGNAVKFTERGNVRVAAQTAPLGDGRIRVSLSVADTGIGMHEEQLSRLFKPFAQADSSTTRRYGGTGLGLSIVRRLAQLMEGDVSVESKPGSGTTFRVSLVLRAAPADSPLRSITPITARVRRRAPVEGAARVLVVDDHPVNLKVLVKQLEMLGITADTAVDGVEALEMWRAGQYAAVLADIHMPRMDGYELAGTIRREEASSDGQRRTPLVAVTANAMRGEEERCLAAGMDAYLAKPVTFDRLRAALSRWLPIEAEDSETTVAAASPAIDESTLRAWLGDDQDTMAELLRDFLRDARQAERDIGVSLGAANLPALAATAHRLKGSALAVGARRLAEVAAELEQAGRAGDRAACQDGLGALARELRRVAGEIGR